MPRSVGSSVTTCPDTKISSIKILEATISSDHGLLKDWTTDWTNSGLVFTQPEWTPAISQVFSHSTGKNIKIKVKLKVSPADGCPETGELVGRISRAMEFKQTGVNFAPGIFEMELESNVPTPEKIQKKSFHVTWVVKTKRKTFFCGNQSHGAYFIYDTPRNDGKPEDGVTLKRMDLATEWVANKIGTKPIDDYFSLVEKLFARFVGYTLSFEHLPKHLLKQVNADPLLTNKLKSYDFPEYMNNSSQTISDASYCIV